MREPIARLARIDGEFPTNCLFRVGLCKRLEKLNFSSISIDLQTGIQSKPESFIFFESRRRYLIQRIVELHPIQNLEL